MKCLGLAAVLVACSSSSTPGTVAIHTPSGLPAGIQLAVTDLTLDLETITGAVIDGRGPGSSCASGELHIEIDPEPTGADPQHYTIDETRCGSDGHRVIVRGGSQLATQWAIYDLLERLGVRYFHPEQTIYPAALAWPAEEIHADETPAFRRRSFGAHRTHPIELSPPLEGHRDMAKFQRHWVDWNVKIRSTEVGSWDEELIGTYAWDRGFPRDTGINLLSSQQGSRPVIDVDDPRPEHEQIAEAIERVMVERSDAPPVSSFGFTFNANEFSLSDETLTVDRLTFITEYINERWPGVEVRTINHGTAQEPGPVYGVRFFDLSQEAPPSLAVQVHTLMFYDLERPAPVYGNADFSFHREFIEREQAVRKIHYFPESSWWLTFDLPVPLYLAPVSLEARDHDLKLLAPYLSSEQDATTGVYGHLTFTTGQEWGYWLIDYCTARMTWDLTLGWEGCLAHAMGAELGALLVEVGKAQVDPMRDSDILAMLVGSDDETEAAELAGIHFHALPPAPVDMLGWDDARVAAFEQASLAPLLALAEQYEGWAVRAEAIASRSELAPIVQEVVDGLRITGLRARHAHETYRAVLGLREGIRTNNFTMVGDATVLADTAKATTDQAREIVRAREMEYRYPPELTIDGDEPGAPGAIPNATIYPYRYLSRTHRLFYWTRPDEQLAAMFGFDVVQVNDRILVDGTPLVVDLVAENVSQLAIAWGDGATSSVIEPHTYGAQGVFEWSVDALHAAGAVHHVDKVAIVDRRFGFPRGSLAITEPSGADLIQGLLPGLVIGLGTDGGGDFLALGRVDGDDVVVAKDTVQVRARTGQSSVTGDLTLSLKNVGNVTVFGAVITVGDGTGATARTLTITGELSTDEVIALVVATGGFDELGARDVVAGTLGYTAETLPARLPFTIAATGTEP